MSGFITPERLLQGGCQRIAGRVKIFSNLCHNGLGAPDSYQTSQIETRSAQVVGIRACSGIFG